MPDFIVMRPAAILYVVAGVMSGLVTLISLVFVPILAIFGAVVLFCIVFGR